uniref:NADH-ubiquinone oxidoreductase chain 2 n=1 Tax=Camaenella platyodon TaxID=2566149 RepID=A0A4D6T4A2_9EUPU|nr:NADH dehydrogenase subunit 2 [Camaenella platyodon]
MSKNLTWWVLFVSLLLGLMTSSWVMLVFMMEVSLFAFIFLVSDYSLLSVSVTGIKYFFAQTVGSILLFSGVLSFLWTNNCFSLAMVILPGLFFKLGVFPFHFWVVPVNKGLTYLMLGILGSPMKILPLWFFNNCYWVYMYNISGLLLFLGMFSMVMGMFLGLKSNTIREMLGASSISHSGWLLFSVLSNDIILYFIFYSLGLFSVIFALVGYQPRLVSICLLGLSGLPPFGVFLGKVLVISHLIAWSGSLWYLVGALISAVMSLYYYLKFSYFFLLHKHDCTGVFLICVILMFNIFCGWLYFLG